MYRFQFTQTSKQNCIDFNINFTLLIIIIQMTKTKIPPNFPQKYCQWKVLSRKEFNST